MRTRVIKKNPKDICKGFGNSFTSCRMIHNLYAPRWVEETSDYHCFTRIKTVSQEWKMQTPACSSALPWPGVASGGVCEVYRTKPLVDHEWDNPGSGGKHFFFFMMLTFMAFTFIFAIILLRFRSSVI